MIAAEETVRIEAPVSEVFAVVDDPSNHIQLTPAVESISDVESLDNGGKRLRYTYQMGPFSFSGVLETPEYVENDRIVFEFTEGRLTGSLVWTFEDLDEGEATEVTYAAEYGLGGGLLETLGRPFVRWYNDRQLRETLANLKGRVEFGLA